MKLKIVMVAAIALALAGCTSTKGRFDSSRLGDVKPGMSKDEVIMALGKPAVAAAVSEFNFLTRPPTPQTREILRYATVSRATRETNHFAVILLDDKVVSYGPEVGYLKSQLEGVFADVPPETPEPCEPSTDGSRTPHGN